MKKVCVCLVLSLIGLAFSFQSASALPPFNKEWDAKYNAGDKNAAYTEAKCNVCHAGESKKMKNEYGKVVGKFHARNIKTATDEIEKLLAGKKE